MKMRKMQTWVLTILTLLFLSASVWGKPDPAFVDTLKSSGSKTIDSQVKKEILEIEKLYGVNPNAMWYNDEDSPNAFAVPYGTQVGRQGTVYLGKEYFTMLAKGPQPEINITTTLAHEYAHVLQMKKWGDAFDSTSSKYIELHADYMSGYLLRLKNYPLADYLNEQFKSGDYSYEDSEHHGTPSERMKSLIAGYHDAVYGSKTLSAHQAFLKGQAFVEKFPKPVKDDPVWGDAVTPKKDDNPVDHTTLPEFPGDRTLTTIERNMTLLLLSDSVDVRTQAAISLGNSGEKGLGSISALAAALSDKNEKVRNAAADALVKLGKLKNPGENRDGLISETVVHGITVITDLTRASEVVALAGVALDPESKDIKEKVAAMKVLEDLGPAAYGSISDLKDYLKDDDKNLRIRSASAMGAIGLHGTGAKSVIPAFRNALKKEKDKDVQKALVNALGGLGKPAVSTLISNLEQGSKDVKILAAEALGRMGADATTAQKALKKAASSQDSKLKEAAKKALEKILKAGSSPGFINTLRRAG